MAYLFDTDALSEALRPRPARRYLEWLLKVNPILAEARAGAP
jgi:predicted nucleic acid-binding protein